MRKNCGDSVFCLTSTRAAPIPWDEASVSSAKLIPLLKMGDPLMFRRLSRHHASSRIKQSLTGTLMR